MGLKIKSIQMIIIFLNNLLAGSKTLKFQPRSIFMTRTLGALTSLGIETENLPFSMAEAVTIDISIQLPQSLKFDKNHRDPLRARKLPLHGYFYSSLKFD